MVILVLYMAIHEQIMNTNIVNDAVAHITDERNSCKAVWLLVHVVKTVELWTPTLMDTRMVVN